MKTHLLPNTILKLALDHQMAIRPMKLQKFMYLTCGLYAACYEKWLIEDDFYAYHYGPVEEKTYQWFKKYGGAPIRDYMYENKILVASARDVYDILDVVFDKYGDWDDMLLSELTHDRAGPWWSAYEKNDGQPISRKDVLNYYQKKIKGGEYPSLKRVLHDSAS